MEAKGRFIYSVILFSALVFLAGYLLFSTLLRDFFLPVFYFMIFYFMLLTIAGRLFLMKSNMSKPGEFSTRYFVVRWIKVILHLIIIVVYILNDRDNIFPFVITFLAGYSLYSAYDIYSLGFYLKKK